MFYVYILKSRTDGMLYTGYTSDLRRRLAEHNSDLKGVGVRVKRRGKSSPPWW